MKWDVKRARILKAIKENEGKEGIPIHKLQKKIKFPRSTLVHYLEELESKGLIKRERKKELGNPIFLKTTPKAKPLLELELDLLDKL